MIGIEIWKIPKNPRTSGFFIFLIGISWGKKSLFWYIRSCEPFRDKYFFSKTAVCPWKAHYNLINLRIIWNLTSNDLKCLFQQKKNIFKVSILNEFASRSLKVIRVQFWKKIESFFLIFSWLVFIYLKNKNLSQIRLFSGFWTQSSELWWPSMTLRQIYSKCLNLNCPIFI